MTLFTISVIQDFIHDLINEAESNFVSSDYLRSQEFRNHVNLRVKQAFGEYINVADSDIKRIVEQHLS